MMTYLAFDILSYLMKTKVLTILNEIDKKKNKIVKFEFLKVLIFFQKLFFFKKLEFLKIWIILK